MFPPYKVVPDYPTFTVGMRRNHMIYYMVDLIPHINHCIWSQDPKLAIGLEEEDAVEIMNWLNDIGRNAFCSSHILEVSDQKQSFEVL